MKMQAIAIHLKPDYDRSPFFKGYDLSSAPYQLVCRRCKSTTSIELSQVTEAAWKWRERFSSEEVEFIQDQFEMNLVGKTPCGRTPAVVKADCSNCGIEYLVYFGCREVSNSVYSMSEQGIIEIEA